MKYMRMLLGTAGFLMLMLGAHLHFVDRVVCDKSSIETAQEFSRILKLDKAYEQIRDGFRKKRPDEEAEGSNVQTALEDAVNAAAEEADRLSNRLNDRVSSVEEEPDAPMDEAAECVAVDSPASRKSRGSLVELEDAYEWTPPGLLSGLLITFGLVVSVMNIATVSKQSDS